MKTKYILVIIILSIICDSYSKAQTAEVTEIIHKQQLAKTTYIFEGKLVDMKQYIGKNQAVTTCIIQIAKIYKGSPEINLGSIKVITDQFYVDNGVLSVPSDGRKTGINKGGTYIFFCKTSNKSWLVDSTITDNVVALTDVGMDEEIVIFTDDSVSWFMTPQFKTVGDIDAFFKANGISVEEEAPIDSAK